MRNYVVIFALLVAVAGSGCTHDPEPIQADEINEITLKWHPSYPTETMNDVLLGLNWAYANVGALHTNAATNGVQYSQNKIHVNTHLLELSSSAQLAMDKLHSAIKSSDEYHRNGAIDVGRYVALLLGSSAHYYQIMDVPVHLAEIVDAYTLQPEHGYLNKSGIAKNHRVVSYSAANGLNQLFVSVEIDSVSKQVLEFETIELLENGHLRFGIFDADSNRINAANPIHSSAGKPAKCMWCHESKILPVFVTQDDYSGYLPFTDFQDTLNRFSAGLAQKQMALTNGIDFTERENHYKMELLYITFHFPTALRLSHEWNMTEDEVEERLSHLSRFSNPEFFYIGSGYIRAEVEPFAPYSSLAVSTSVREESAIEVNYIE